MIRNHNHPFWKLRLEPPILSHDELIRDLGVAADDDLDGAEPLHDRVADVAKLLLCQGHPGVEVVFADEVEGQAEDLNGVDAGLCLVMSGTLWRLNRSRAVLPFLKGHFLDMERGTYERQAQMK